ncbi:hypothetical protein PanWU01x14_268580 [Parasponia andersonii]|uniref:Uncharacterized protein n=1 Tax=Parasponia andersonii TaxID=3476 RepID=A0A2P5B5W7_PARAD|nr:hypothetical protein PanWU01x14_268580 [Parasponia andersonii]
MVSRSNEWPREQLSMNLFRVSINERVMLLLMIFLIARCALERIDRPYHPLGTL